jgi:hypothetical protein
MYAEIWGCTNARLATRRLGRGYLRNFSLSHKLLRSPVVVGRVLLLRHDVMVSLCDSKAQRLPVARRHCSSLLRGLVRLTERLVVRWYIV